MPSFYVNFTEHTVDLEVTGEEHHHIGNVFRQKAGNIIPLVNGKGLKAKGMIKDLNKKSLSLQLSDFVFVERPMVRVACAFSLLRGRHDLMTVEKLTELGVVDLFPMQTKNSVKLSKDNTADRMRKVAISAMKQCDNPWLAEVHGTQELKAVLCKIKDMDYMPLVASELRPEDTLVSKIVNWREATQVSRGICVIIGPEGGFDSAEFALFEKNSIQQVSISKNILRAETAAICAVSQLMGYL